MEFSRITQLPPITSITEMGKKENQANQVNQAENNGTTFADIYQGMIDNVKETQSIADQDSLNLALGNVDDLHTVMINAQKAEFAVNMTVAVTNKIVNAYNEIVKMNI